MELDLDKVRANALRSTTEDLLDRVTVYRAGMEPEALVVLEAELNRRGIGPAQIEAHAESRGGSLILGPDGIPLSCAYCRRPAVSVRWAWYRLGGLLPLFPLRVPCCTEHDRPGGSSASPTPSPQGEGR